MLLAENDIADQIRRLFGMLRMENKENWQQVWGKEDEEAKIKELKQTHGHGGHSHDHGGHSHDHGHSH